MLILIISNCQQLSDGKLLFSFFHRPWMSWISNVSGWQQLHATPQLNSLKWPTEKESVRFVTLFLTSGQWLSRNGECNKTTAQHVYISIRHPLYYIRVLTYESSTAIIILIQQQEKNLKVKLHIVAHGEILCHSTRSSTQLDGESRSKLFLLSIDILLYDGGC